MNPDLDRREPHPASVVRIDDRMCVEHDPLSSQVSGLLHAAEDNLHGVRVMIRDAQVIHTFAEYAMVRGAIESAAMAWWLMAPEDRRERVKRHLRLIWRDTLDMHEALGDLQEIEARKETRRQEILEAASAAGIASNDAFARWGYKGIVQAFSEATKVPALLTWQAASGMVHARRWAMGALSSLEAQHRFPTRNRSRQR